MEELSQQMWGETNSLEGAVSSNVSQEVRLMEKQLVSQVHVQEGQEVKEGDPLLTYDMTLVNIDLEMEKLNREQLKVKKKGLENELKNLKDDKKNMAVGRGYKVEFLSNIEENPEIKPEEPKPEQPETPQEQARPSGVYKRLYRDITIDNTEFPNDDAIIENAIPYSGKGTKEEPYVYVCQKGVLIQGEFLNQLAGFDVSGNRVREPYYCKLEVRSDNSFDGTLQAAMILDGSAIESAVEPSAWFRTRLGKNEWEEMLPEEDVPQGEVLPELPDGTGNEIPEEEIVGGYSKEELEKAIKEKEKEENKLSTVVVMKELVHNIPFMLFLVISFFFWGACSTNFNYLSLFIKSQGGTASQVGTYQLFATLFEIPMILATDYIIKKIPYRYIMMFAIIMSMINFAWYATLPSVNMIIYVFVFKGFSTVLFTMITVRLVMVLVKEEYVSTAYGIQAMLGKGVGAMLFQLIGGRIIDSIGMNGFYLFLFEGITIAFVVTLFFRMPRKVRV